MLAEMLTLLMASRIMSYIMDLTVDTSVTQRRITIDIKTSIFHAYFAFSVFKYCVNLKTEIFFVQF